MSLAAIRLDTRAALGHLAAVTDALRQLDRLAMDALMQGSPDLEAMSTAFSTALSALALAAPHLSSAGGQLLLEGAPAPAADGTAARAVGPPPGWADDWACAQDELYDEPEPS